jgi:hypothetical protein
MKIMEMNDELVQIFVQLTMLKESDAPHLSNDIIEGGGWVLKAIDKNFEAINLQCSKRVQIMLLAISNGAVGRAVQYIRPIYDWAKETGSTEITWEDFNLRIFPMGYPDFTKD